MTTRRAFVRGIGMAAAAGLVGVTSRLVEADPPLEVTRLRLVDTASICFAPQFVAEELLKHEGFVDVTYVKTHPSPYKALAAGAADLNTGMVAQFILQIEAGEPITVLTGTHTGCFELFGGDRVRSVKDLKGKTVAVPGLGTSHHLYVASMAAYVGLDARRDITFVTPATTEATRLLADGKIDAIVGFPPVAQELRAEKIGHVVVDSRVDRPWSQYFCCMLAGNREFVQRHPVATKRAVRAIMKANEVCALEPDRVARLLVDKGQASHYDYARQALRELPYAKWREYDPEDTVRFYALRLHEAGMIKSNPQKILAQGTDWRFLQELKRELKG